MSTYIIVAIVTIIVVAMVLILSLVTISKGYAYKHTVDPLPDKDKETDKTDYQEE